MRWDLLGVALLLALSVVLIVRSPIGGIVRFIIAFILIKRMFRKFKKDELVLEDEDKGFNE